MNIPLANSNPRCERGGFAVIAIMAMLAIMMICLAVNNVTMRSMDRELDLLEKKQAQRWQTVQSHAPLTPTLSMNRLSSLSTPSPQPSPPLRAGEREKTSAATP